MKVNLTLCLSKHRCPPGGQQRHLYRGGISGHGAIVEYRWDRTLPYAATVRVQQWLTPSFTLRCSVELETVNGAQVTKATRVLTWELPCSCGYLRWKASPELFATERTSLSNFRHNNLPCVKHGTQLSGANRQLLSSTNLLV